jgi:hypothetical protein
MGCMGKKLYPQKPADLRDAAAALKEAAAKLESLAERMDRKQIKGILVQHTQGMAEALRATIPLYLADCERRAHEAGA